MQAVATALLVHYAGLTDETRIFRVKPFRLFDLSCRNYKDRFPLACYPHKYRNAV
jgi:hypothetical protein